MPCEPGYGVVSLSDVNRRGNGRTPHEQRKA